MQRPLVVARPLGRGQAQAGRLACRSCMSCWLLPGTCRNRCGICWFCQSRAKHLFPSGVSQRYSCRLWKTCRGFCPQSQSSVEVSQSWKYPEECCRVAAPPGLACRELLPPVFGWKCSSVISHLCRRWRGRLNFPSILTVRIYLALSSCAFKMFWPIYTTKPIKTT